MPSRLTFGQVLNSNLPQALGLCSQDRVAVAAYVNEATERLIADPLAPDEGWPGSWERMLFNVSVVNHVGTITTPRRVARLIVTDICGHPRFLRNGFFEFLLFTPGIRPKQCGSNCCETQQIFERDNVATLNDFPTTAPQQVRCYPTDAADIGRRVVLQGPDQNGIEVLGTDVATGASNLGETLILQQPFSTSLNSFQTIQGLLKDVTKGPVSFFTVDASGTQTLLSSMEPSETTASYRRYQLVGLPTHCCQQPLGTVQVQAQARIDFEPVASDTDYILINSLPALIEECLAIKFGRMDSPQAPAFEDRHHRKAISILNGTLDLIEGKVSTAISVSLFGSNPARRQPV